MGANSEKELVAEFFYSGFERTWPKATPQQMFPIYVNEINRLFAALESREPYYQEFARDYPLATELRSKVSGEDLKYWTQPTDARNHTPFYVPPSVSVQPYSIIPTASGIVFKRYREQVLTLPYRTFFNYLESNIELLRSKFPHEINNQETQDKINEQRLEFFKEVLQNPRSNSFARKNAETWIRVLESSGHWDQRLDHLRSLEWSKLFNKITSTLQFWKSKEIEGSPDKIYTGSKKLALKPGDLVSFKQLDCPDTLTSLTADALYKYTDLDELRHYVNLKTLALRHMHVKDISFVANLTKLDELILHNNEITDISPISNLPVLTHLYLVGNKIQDFSPIFTLPRLKTLYIDDAQLPNKKDWEQFPSYVNLNIVHTTPHEGRSEDGIPKFMVDMVYQRKPRRHFKQPQAVASPNTTNNEQAKAKKDQAPDPRKLSIRDRYLYSALTNSLGHTPAVIHDITKLKRLDCSNYIELQPDHTFLDQPGDFSCLQHATALRSLTLDDRRVEDFRVLSSCTSLQELSLARTEISDLAPLFNLAKLKRLNLCGCEHLILDKDTIVWLLSIPNLEVDAKVSQLLFDKVYTYFLGQCQDNDISPVLRNELGTNARALQQERNTPKHSEGVAIYDFDDLDTILGLNTFAREEEMLSEQNELDENDEQDRQESKAKIIAPLDTPLNTEILPSELALYFYTLSYVGLRQYLSFVRLIKEWDGTIGQTNTSLWLISPNSVLNHPLTYPWLKPFNQYGVACEKYVQDLRAAAQQQITIFEQMLPIIFSLYPRLTTEDEVEIREELLYQIKQLNLTRPYTYQKAFWDEFFADFGIEIQEPLIELYNQFITVKYPVRPDLERFWRHYMPFLVTHTPVQNQDSSVLDKVNPNSAYYDLLKFTADGYTTYLIEVDSGQIYRLLPDPKTPKPKAELVAPNLLFFLNNWKKLLLPSSQPSTGTTWEA